MFRRSFMALALATGTLSLAACGETPTEAPGAETGIPGMKISNARMVLAPVAGNPAAIYFDLAYEGDRGVALNRAEVKGAKSAMFHDYGEYDFKVQMMEMLPVPLKKGDTVTFEPGGMHLMLMQPRAPLKEGSRVVVNFKLQDGREILGIPDVASEENAESVGGCGHFRRSRTIGLQKHALRPTGKVPNLRAVPAVVADAVDKGT